MFLWFIPIIKPPNDASDPGNAVELLRWFFVLRPAGGAVWEWAAETFEMWGNTTSCSDLLHKRWSSGVKRWVWGSDGWDSSCSKRPTVWEEAIIPDCHLESAALLSSCQAKSLDYGITAVMLLDAVRQEIWRPVVLTDHRPVASGWSSRWRTCWFASDEDSDGRWRSGQDFSGLKTYTPRPFNPRTSLILHVMDPTGVRTKRLGFWSISTWWMCAATSTRTDPDFHRLFFTHNSDHLKLQTERTRKCFFLNLFWSSSGEPESTIASCSCSCSSCFKFLQTLIRTNGPKDFASSSLD